MLWVVWWRWWLLIGLIGMVAVRSETSIGYMCALDLPATPKHTADISLRRMSALPSSLSSFLNSLCPVPPSLPSLPTLLAETVTNHVISDKHQLIWVIG